MSKSIFVNAPIISLRAEYLPGTAISDAVIKSISLARYHGCRVSFDFNDVNICVDKSSDADAMISLYWKSFKRT